MLSIFYFSAKLAWSILQKLDISIIPVLFYHQENPIGNQTKRNEVRK